MAENICIAPGAMFSASPRFRHCIRLGVGGRWGAEHPQALCRVGALAGQMLAEALSKRAA
jgi:DNA-binding transcriptional MocR family regulator